MIVYEYKKRIKGGKEMKNIKKIIKNRIAIPILIIVCILLVGQQASAYYPQSVNVAIIGSPGVINGGTFPTSGTDFSSFTFTNLHPDDVNPQNLANYDTVLLNVASSEMYCYMDTLSTQAKADLVSFVGNGGKLIIYDSECPAQDYSWLPYPFTTNNPGAMGAQGTLTIVEDNTLSHNSPADPCYVDAATLGSSTDAVGDMNVMTTLDAAWCLDMSGTNYNQVTGPVHTYARYSTDPAKEGLIIYNGLDVDYMGWYDPTSGYGLEKIWLLELKQDFNPSSLPCGHTVVGIDLTPPSDENEVGEAHTITATLTDLLSNPQPGILVSFSVIFGPNAGTTGTCNPADCTTDANGEVSYTYTGDGGVGTDQIEACFYDSAQNLICSQIVTKDWIIINQPPEADCNGPYVVDEGSSILFDGSGSTDPDGDTMSYDWDYENDGTYDANGVQVTNTWNDDHIGFILLLVTDGHGAYDTATCTVTVNNVPPTITSLTGPTDPVEVNTVVTMTADFTDPGTEDTHTAEWDWGDSTTSSGTVDETSGSGSAEGTHTYDTPGVYTVQLTVTDDDGGFDTETFQYVVVYDPDGGFVTGGGWIDSPEGAYVADSSLTGTANFGFVSKYKKGAMAPTGQTEFQFQAGDLNFHSSSYDWLVIANHKAIYKGTGTINGDGNYGFMLFAIDEKLTPSTDVDMFRIKIWDINNNDAVVYDNEISEDEDAPPTTPIIGGSIVIHK